MKRKSKVSYKIRVRSVEMYIKGEKGATEIANNIGISVARFMQWIRKYIINGTEGLKTIYKNKSYSPELKHLAVEEYISGKSSLYEICSKYNISSHGVLQRWIIKYNNNHNSNKSHNTGEGIIMIKGRKITYNERIEIVAFCIESNDNYQLTSDKYKVSYQQVYTWVRKYKENGHEALIDNRGKSKNLEQMSDSEKLMAQIKLLKAKNKRLEMENDFLKKLEEIERRRF